MEALQTNLIDKPKSAVQNAVGGFSRRIKDVLKSVIDRGVSTAVASGGLGVLVGAGVGIASGGASILPSIIGWGVGSLKLGAVVGGVIGAVEGVIGKKF